jgi:hypothetical protein
VRRAALAAALGALVFPGAAFAHGIGGIRDLPVPTWLFFYGGAIVLVLSFVALGALWRQPLLERHADGRPLPPWLERVVLSNVLRVVLGALSLAILVGVWLSALLGSESSSANFAPVFVYVVFWLGLVPVVVLLGDVWPALNPWRAGGDAVAWVGERIGWHGEPLLHYPERLGRWPAAGLLLAFAALELAYVNPASPRALAIAIALYTWITAFGMLLYSRRVWLANGEAFTSYFGLLARMAPFARRGDRLVVRWPLTGLADSNHPPGTVAFVAVMLGSVGFDGFSRTRLWQDRYFSIRTRLFDHPTLADLASFCFNLAGLLLTVAVVGLAFLAAVRAARALTNYERPLALAFVGSLVPIALAYAVAHYFSLLVQQSQVAFRLASDPLGRGWDLFGTSSFRPDLTILSPNVIWYVQVGALVVGHVLGLAVAHDRAVSLFRSPREAVRSQYPMLALMVAYTVGGMWVLSQS